MHRAYLCGREADATVIDEEYACMERQLSRSLVTPDAEKFLGDEDEEDDGKDEDENGAAVAPAASTDPEHNDLNDEETNDGGADEDSGFQQDAEFVRATAKAHMDKNPCKCKSKDCYFEGSEDLAVSMRRKTPAERTTALRGMLLALAAPPGIPNELKKCTRKRSHDASQATGKPRGRATVEYAIRGRRVCRGAFIGMMQVSDATLRLHLGQVSGSAAFETHQDRRGGPRFGFRSAHTGIALAFLERYAQREGQTCPPGRREANGKQLRLLPATETRKSVWSIYTSKFQELAKVLPGNDVPPTPLALQAFYAVWRRHMPHLRILSKGSDFCEYCTVMCQSRHAEAWQAVATHRQIASAARDHYNDMRLRARDPSADYFHATFDFAEKVLLPQPIHDPGWLYFVSGLKFDIFGVSLSNTQRHMHFGLAEGHWPNEKGPNTVLSMLDKALQCDEAKQHRRHLLHADNCAKQNKNNHTLYYLALRTIVGLSDEAALHFMSAGHTTSMTDAYFGKAKQRLREDGAWTPKDMMGVLEQSTEASTTAIPASGVVWADWETFLGRYFQKTVPQLKRYHAFRFHKDAPGTVFCRKLVTDAEETPVELLSAPAVDTAARLRSDWLLGHRPHPASFPALTEIPCTTGPQSRTLYLEEHVVRHMRDHNSDVQADFFQDGSKAMRRAPGSVA